VSERGWALVTGASRRIGQALAVCAAEAGFDVLIHVREVAAGETTASAVRALGRQAQIVTADLTSPAIGADLIGAARGAVRLAVNSASVFDDDRVGAVTAEGLDAAFAVNTRAPILIGQAMAATLPAGETGLIVNVIDQKVLRLDPRFFSYSVAKSALWAATLMMAQALAPAVRVNAIGPGPTLPSPHQTPQSFAAEAAGTLLGQPVGAQPIAEALRYFIDADFVTGQMIAVDAGQHLGWRTPDVVEP
jgi:NAD(P)-dependent dehydrogenase (short-subunit alcohol dehydrogenase family)